MDAVEEEVPCIQIAHVQKGTDRNDAGYRSRDGASNQAREVSSQARVAKGLPREDVRFSRGLLKPHVKTETAFIELVQS